MKFRTIEQKNVEFFAHLNNNGGPGLTRRNA